MRKLVHVGKNKTGGLAFLADENTLWRRAHVRNPDTGRNEPRWGWETVFPEPIEDIEWCGGGVMLAVLVDGSVWERRWKNDKGTWDEIALEYPDLDGAEIKP